MNKRQSEFKSCLGGLVIVAVMFGAMLVALRSCISAGRNSSAQATSEQPASGLRSEADIATLCDEAVESTLKSQSSYSPAWSWRFNRGPGYAMLIRNFEAINSFGTKMSSVYQCKFSDTQGRIVRLDVTSGGSITNVINAE